MMREEVTSIYLAVLSFSLYCGSQRFSGPRIPGQTESHPRLKFHPATSLLRDTAISLAALGALTFSWRFAMSQPYIGEIRMAGFNFAPAGWAFCNGQLLPIADYSALFNLIGTTYGGDGENTFGLPNLQCRIPFHQGNGFVLAQISGTENVTLTTNQIPAHTHSLAANSSGGTQPGPGGGLWAASSLDQFSTEAPSHSMAATAIASTGGSQPHDNMPPFLAVNFIISLFGIYPSQS